MVIFDEPCGKRIQDNGNSRIYDFSNNGVFITSKSQTTGLIDRNFYLVKGNGNRKQITEYHWSELEKEKKDLHWIISGEKPTKDSTGIFWAYHNSFSFYVSDYKSIDTRHKKKQEEKFHKLAADLLKQCRSTK